MGPKAPRLIITDDGASMKSTIRSSFSDIVHRLCMWHNMEKVPEKVGPPTKHDDSFWSRLKAYVRGSKTGDKFEMEWNAIISEFGLHENYEWFTNRYRIHKSWIPIPLHENYEWFTNRYPIHSSIDLFITIYHLLSFSSDLI
jgi:hypothetical protein